MKERRVHLLSYATARFRLRQMVLGASARANRVVDTVHSYSTARLEQEGFREFAPEIGLDERGSGFWAWKPFLIQKHLEQVPDGDLVFYCDVGRVYPFKQIDRPLDPWLGWMDERNQDVMPGVYIPWNGPMEMWTKRAALLAMDMDREDILKRPPIQASFSIWRASEGSRALAREWAELCAQRRLVSDDPDDSGRDPHEKYFEHRHDQSLLSLVCLKHAVEAVDLGADEPSMVTQNPSEVADFLFGSEGQSSPVLGKLVSLGSTMIAGAERSLRKLVSFNEDRPAPPVPDGGHQEDGTSRSQGGRN